MRSGRPGFSGGLPPPVTPGGAGAAAAAAPGGAAPCFTRHSPIAEYETLCLIGGDVSDVIARSLGRAIRRLAPRHPRCLPPACATACHRRRRGALSVPCASPPRRYGLRAN